MNIAFYAYGNHEIGLGHIYRSMALAEAFKEKLRALHPSVSFLSRDYETGITKLQESGYGVYKIPTGLTEQEETEYCSKILKELSLDLFITDALEISTAKMSLFKNHSGYLVSIDDTKEGRLLANLAISALYEAYVTSDNLLELKGFKYFIIRRECNAFNRPNVTIKPVVKRILVTQGGGDFHDVTMKIAKALEHLDEKIEIVLLLGSAFRREEELCEHIRGLKRRFVIEKNVRDIVGLFSRCDLAITAAGITLLELTAVGVPCIVLTQERKEIETAQNFAAHGFIRNLGLSENVSERDIYRSVNELISNYPLRVQMSKKSREAIDGLGAERIVDIIFENMKMQSINLEDATDKKMDL